MAKLTKEEIMESLKEMTVLELKDLVDAMKEEFGVDPSAVVAAAPAAGGAAAAEEGPAEVDIVLKEAGANKLAVIKIIREITGLGLKEAKDIADKGGVVKEKLNADEANKLKAKLEEAGATIELK
jgi:large subunit ribosomal protein L7/L12